jgi:hypothetical protein
VSLTSVIIGSGVLSIGDQAFGFCTSLASVTIPNNVQSFGGYAFQGCTSLVSVTIGSGVTQIGRDSFNGCTNLDNMIFNGPLTTTNIGITIFDGIEQNITRTFTFYSTSSATLIQQSLLDQIKLITVDDTSTGPQIFFLPTPNNISNDIYNDATLLNFLATDAKYGNIINSVVVTSDLINTSNTPKILMNTTNALISITIN